MSNINFYYDVITKRGPVPNGLSSYTNNKRICPFPFNNIHSPAWMVSPVTGFYNLMLTNGCAIDIFTKKKFCENLFYPLEIRQTGINVVIPPTTLNYLKKGKLKLLLLAPTQRNYSQMCVIKEIAAKFVKLKVPLENIFIVTGDINNSYKELFSPYKAYSIDWWQIESQAIIKNNNNTMKKYELFGNLPKTPLPVKDYNINSFNPTLLFHTFSTNDSNTRTLLIDRLKDANLYDKGTIISKNDSIDHHTNSLVTIITPEEQSIKNVNYMSEVNALFTNLEIWELIVMGKPFIILGCQQMIRYLNSQGYTTFYDLINEKYDSYLDYEIKVDLICNELSRISNDDNSTILKTIKKLAEVNKVKFLNKSHQHTFLKLFDKMRYGIT